MDEGQWTIRGLKLRLITHLVRSLADDGNLRSHAECELASSLAEDTDSPNRWAADNLVDLVCLFATQGHSGFSAAWVRNQFNLLADFKPLGPLTGEDGEWNEVGTNCYQNRRCSHVFKDEDGAAYDSQGKIFREPNGSCYTSGDSRVFVEFPYTPTTEYVDVAASDAQ